MVTKAKAEKAPKKEADLGLRLTADKAELIGAIDAATRVAKNVAKAPVLTCAHLELVGNDLVVTGSNMEVFVATNVTVAGAGNGTVAVPARPLAEIVRSCPGEKVTLRFMEGRLEVASELFKAALVTQPDGEFPRLPEVDGFAVAYGLDEFVTVMSRVLPAAAKTDDRPALAAVCFEPGEDRLTVAATDSYRLATDSVSGAGPGERTLIPGDALAEVLGAVGRNKDEDATISVLYGVVPEAETPPEGEEAPPAPHRWVRFDAGATRIVVRPLSDSSYPQYGGLFPEGMTTAVSVDRKALLDAINRMRLILTGSDAKDGLPVRVILGSTTLEVEAEGDKRGRAGERIEAEVMGEAVSLAFNVSFLTDALRATDAKLVELSLNGTGRPAVLTFPGVATYSHLVMPIKVTDGRADEPESEDEGEGATEPSDDVVLDPAGAEVDDAQVAESA